MHGFKASSFDVFGLLYSVRGGTIIPQLDARGRVYLSMVFFHFCGDSHSLSILQNFSTAAFHYGLLIPRSAREIHISDSILDDLKICWDVSLCRIQPLLKENRLPLLRAFLDIKLPELSYACDSQPKKMYIGRIFSRHADTRHGLKLLSSSTAQQEIGRIKLPEQPNLEWNSMGWKEVAIGLWRRRLVHSHSWILLNKPIISAFSAVSTIF